MSKVDLHLHSSYSYDGDYTPEQLADQCILKGIEMFAIADHNNTNGIERVILYCKDKSVSVVPAIELDCVYKGIELHVLGYGIQYRDSIYSEVWLDILHKEQAVARKRIQSIRALGIELSDEKINSISKWGVVVGETLGEAAMDYDRGHKNRLLKPYYEGGDRRDNPYVNFYWDFCSQGKPAYSPIDYMHLDQALDIIHKTGGISVLAHPGMQIKENTEILSEIISHGIQGIEVFSSYHSGSQIQFYKDFAMQNNVLITCGSDFHGKTKPNVRIGRIDCGNCDDQIKLKFSEILNL